MKENEISKLKETYPPGTRIVLMYMGYDPHPILGCCMLFL